ncbi:ScaI family restriction endonuclease [Microbacterium paraoxydans]|uniref:ScaI family restriction endonuclease n=1 Tax=Microbacterium paraoxydans TaxID=199592 RepID=UPI0011AA475D|nr:ScaI family restriction endonuclease [Microbacterium paraoxydans]
MTLAQFDIGDRNVDTQFVSSPYFQLPTSEWRSTTLALINEHPLNHDELVEVILKCWDDIFTTTIAGRLRVGDDVKFSPQMMANFLDELIPVELAERYPQMWRRQAAKHEKDLVCIQNDFYSTEIKCSSSANDIFANRSYAQPSAPGTKPKDGFYIAVNFQGFALTSTPRITRIKLGWLDHTDWIPQASATGQQARLTPESKASKLIQLYPKS